MGLPFVQPYFGGGSNGDRSFAEGVNFAVAGATAMDISFFTERGIINSATNVSLGNELDWFKQMLSSFCHTPSRCKEYLENSVVLMGEIGGNDYNYAFLQGHPKEEVLSFVPKVITVIASTINELIKYGVQTLIVPGNLPIGCSASYLSYFMTSNASEYDPQTGCINWLNDFAEYHNELLQEELDRLIELHPHTTIVYADYYNAAMRLYKSPRFNNTLDACCGGGGPYNSNEHVYCGSQLSTVCDSPSSYINWDGSHLTEAAYRWIANGLLKGPYTSPQINGQFLVLFVSTGHVAGCYKAIVSFGDSLTDTGNLIRMSQSSNGYVMSAVLPYGETYFHHPTGRYSDGRLIIDFIALSMGLPFVEPYFGGKSSGDRSFTKGVNFAVAGATAMDISFFTERGITNRCTNASLGTELEWFKHMMSSFCDTPSSKLSSAPLVFPLYILK
nr:GDSL esterase/lipase At1g28590-like [Ipomoea batatas]